MSIESVNEILNSEVFKNEYNSYINRNEKGIQQLKSFLDNIETNKKYYDLINEFYKLTKIPIVLNTSFNLKDQTMVLDPKSAIETFLNCEMDTLVIHNYVIKKKIL